MKRITRRSFLGLLKLLPFVPLVARLPAPPAPIVERAAETASDQGGFLVPAEFVAQLRQAAASGAPATVVFPKVTYTYQVSQELLDDSAAFSGFVQQAFQDEMSKMVEVDNAFWDDKIINGTGSSQPTGIIHP